MKLGNVISFTFIFGFLKICIRAVKTLEFYIESKHLYELFQEESANEIIFQ